jgi:hypothetical protein
MIFRFIQSLKLHRHTKLQDTTLSTVAWMFFHLTNVNRYICLQEMKTHLVEELIDGKMFTQSFIDVWW